MADDWDKLPDAGAPRADPWSSLPDAKPQAFPSTPELPPPAMAQRLQDGENFRTWADMWLRGTKESIAKRFKEAYDKNQWGVAAWEFAKFFGVSTIDSAWDFLTLGHDVMKQPMEDKELTARSLNAAEWMLGLSSARPALVKGRQIVRLEADPVTQTVAERPVGNLPNEKDFHDAATAINNGVEAEHTVQNLKQEWQKNAVHPSEVAVDAEKDPILQQEMKSVNTAKPKEEPEIVEENIQEAGKKLAENSVKTINEAAKQTQEEAAAKAAVEAGKALGEKISELVKGEKPKGGVEAKSAEEPTDPVKTITSMISKEESTPSYSFSKLYRDFVDRGWALKKAVDRLAKSPLGVDEDPYKAFRLFSGWQGKAEAFIEHGPYDFNTLKTTAKPLSEIFKSLDGRLDEYRSYIIARRALELESQGHRTNVNLDAANQVIQKYKNEFEPIAQAHTEYHNALLKYLADSGVISKDLFNELVKTHSTYIPLFRIGGAANEFAGRLGRSSLNLEAYNPLYELKDKVKPLSPDMRQAILVDPLESSIRLTYLYINLAERNRVATSIVNLFKNLAPKEIVKLEKGHNLTQEQVAERAVSVYENGKRTAYAIDPEIAGMMRNLDGESAGLLERILAPLTKTLRAGSVLNPEFQLRHTFRDFFYAFVTSPGHFTPLDMIRGFSGLIFKDEDYWNWLKSGAGQVSYVSMDRRYLQERLDKLADQTGLWTRAKNIVIDPDATWLQKSGRILGLPVHAVSQYILHPLQVVTEMVTSASHLGVYKKMLREMPLRAGVPVVQAVNTGNLPSKGVLWLKKGYTFSTAFDGETLRQAAWEARDAAVDMGRIGARFRAYNMISAFANAKVQDTDRVFRALREKPFSSALRILTGITIPSLLLWLYNKDDSRYQELPTWEKDMFWIILTDRWQPAVGQDDPEHVLFPGREFLVTAVILVVEPQQQGRDGDAGQDAQGRRERLLAERPEHPIRILHLRIGEGGDHVVGTEPSANTAHVHGRIPGFPGGLAQRFAIEGCGEGVAFLQPQHALGWQVPGIDRLDDGNSGAKRHFPEHLLVDAQVTGGGHHFRHHL